VTIAKFVFAVPDVQSAKDTNGIQFFALARMTSAAFSPIM
jgi:hypothetical protein